MGHERARISETLANSEPACQKIQRNGVGNHVSDETEIIVWRWIEPRLQNCRDFSSGKFFDDESTGFLPRSFKDLGVIDNFRWGGSNSQERQQALRELFREEIVQPF